MVPMNIGYTAVASDGVEDDCDDIGGMTLKFVRGYLPPKKKKYYLNYRNTLLV
jgi:hypothetical protein